MENQQQPKPSIVRRLADRLFSASLYPLPQHLLSRLVGRITRSTSPTIKNLLIQWFIHRYGVDMSQARLPDPTTYESFNAFFTRALREDARPLPTDPHGIACPVDGTVSQVGDIHDGLLIQAKGREFSLDELFGPDNDCAEEYAGGRFATLYLSPRDYHRVHMPLSGTLRGMSLIPGRLFSVCPATARTIPNLYARNERLITRFETEIGPMAVILVGAIFVGSMEAQWCGEVTPIKGKQIRRWRYGEHRLPVRLDRGHEMGRFNMGSTVILLFGRDSMAWSEDLAPDQRVVMGQTIGRVA